MKILKFVFTFSIMLIISKSYSQTNESFICGTESSGETMTLTQTGSLYKPAMNAPGEYFKALIVFVQFEGDTREDAGWPLNQLPVWAYDFIDSSPSSSYRDLTLSDYWSDMSQSNFDFIGDIYPNLVILPSESQYQSQGKNHTHANQDVIAAIDPYVNFSNYDKWSYSSGTQTFEFSPDGYVDMIYIIYRNPGEPPYKNWFGSFTARASLGYSSFEYTTDEGKIISSGGGGISTEGSGITVRQGLRGHYDLIAICAHEFGHYLFGAVHWNYSGIMGSGTYTMNGWERERLGYIAYTNATQNNFTITLSDFIKSGEILRVPIPITDPNSSTYFLVENHQRESSYDQIMRGGEIGGGYDFSTTLGSGIYIWKVTNGNSNWPTFEIVTADGKFDWQYVGDYYAGPGWYEGQPYEGYLPKTIRSAVNRNNGKNDRMPNHIYWNNHWASKWVDINPETKEWEITRNVMGDKTDAFNFGYNEIFTPWSNPSSYFNGTTNISIELFSQNGNDITVKVYSTAESAEVLPPAKPQNLSYEIIEGQYLGDSATALRWDANTEPDMLTDGAKYKIFRAESSPLSYYLLATIDAYSNGSPVTNWIDWEPCHGSNKLYYKISAVDNTQKESVPSDPVWRYGRLCKEGANYEEETVEDVKYENYLLQNYPNPFNPATNISFSIPEKLFVTLKVYNILGKEIANLINGYREKGNYSVRFDGSKLSSGTYIYKLTAGNKILVRKMLLVK